MYEVGEFVRVKEKEKCNSGILSLIPPMYKYCGNIYKIQSAKTIYGGLYYELEGAKDSKYDQWLFFCKWLEPAGPQIEINDDEILEMFKQC